VLGYLKRLVTAGAAYQFGEILAKALALLTLPLYTRHVSPKSYGAAEALFTAVILSSIVLRLGVGEAFIRYYYDDEDPARRKRLAGTATATVLWTTTIAALVALAFSDQLSKLLLNFEDATLMNAAVLGLWAFTNLEMAYAQLRVDERKRVFLCASGANTLLTIAFTIALVVVGGEEARGLLLGNFGATALIVLALWWVLRDRFSLRVRHAELRAMLHFGLPTVPADASVYALQVADRFYLFRSYSHAAAGLYAIAIKLATVVFVAVRGFQYAWPPLAYSIESDDEAARLYSLVTTYYALATGIVVCGVALLARWLVRLLAAERYFGAYRALPWLALGWALYGLFLVFVTIAGRARVTRRTFVAAIAGLAANIALLLVLVPGSGAGLGIAGAGLALCGAYAVMLVVTYRLTHSLFKVGFEWRRLLQLTTVFAAVAVSGELLLPTSGIGGLASRAAWLALAPGLLLATGFVHDHERQQARALLADGRRRVAAFRAGHGDVEAYAEDPLRDV
jgi:O-antigen/teichoic acid export membrane protein